MGYSTGNDRAGVQLRRVPADFDDGPSVDRLNTVGSSCPPTSGRNNLKDLPHIN